MTTLTHAIDCAIHDPAAEPPGVCDCGAEPQPTTELDQAIAYLRSVVATEFAERGTHRIAAERVIAAAEAAPKLLESLRNLIGLAKMRGGQLYEYAVAIKDAEAAIAKAESAQ